jgi:hypothetical protein
MPEARPVARRFDDSAGDMASLVRLGLTERKPVPDKPPRPPVDQNPPRPGADPADEAEAAALSAALTEAGIPTTARDQDAIKALAKLDPDTVAAVERWLKTKKPRPDEPPDRSK